MSRDGDATTRIYTLGPDADGPGVAEPIVLVELHGHEFGPGGRLVAQDAEGHPVLLDLDRPDGPPIVLATPEDLLFSPDRYAFSPDGGWLAASGREPEVYLWRLGPVPDPEPRILDAPGESSGYNELRFSPDGRWLVGASFDTVGELFLWSLDAETPAAPTKLGQVGGFRSLAFSPDSGQFVFGDADHAVQFWSLDRREPRPIASARGSDSEIVEVHFGAGGRWVVSRSFAGDIRLWDRKAPGSPASPIVTGRPPARPAFSPDGRRLLGIGDDGTPLLWDLTDPGSPAPPRVLTGISGSIEHARFSPDGRWLALMNAPTWDEDGRRRGEPLVSLWPLGPGDPDAPPITLPAPSGAATSMMFSPDGRWLVTAGGARAAPGLPHDPRVRPRAGRPPRPRTPERQRPGHQPRRPLARHARPRLG